MPHPPQKPRLALALKLRCPYCGVTPLRFGKSWFRFNPGCERCDYNFEREVGYFTGASWMVNFPAVSLLGLAIGAVVLALSPGMDAVHIALIAIVVMVPFGTFFTLFSMAIWLYADHRLHPLDDNDHFGGASTR